MEKRRLGNSDLDLTAIGFGAWAIGGPWLHGWGKQEDNASIRAIQYALDQGINWIDTAHVYGFGHSERIVGQAIKGRKDQAIIATKCGLLADSKGGIYGCLKAKSVREELEGSLKRLDIEPIDLYQIHWPDPKEDIEEAWEEIQKAIQQGKIRYAGVSNFSPKQMQRLGKIAPITSLQPPYSMLRRQIEEEILPYCREKNIGVVPYSPMLSGMLTGKVTPEWVASLPEDDWRKHNNVEFQEPNLSINIEFIETTLRPIADQYKVDPGQIAVAWVLRDPVVTSAIVGARSEKQVEQTLRAAQINLTDKDLKKIEQGLAQRQDLLREKSS